MTWLHLAMAYVTVMDAMTATASMWGPLAMAAGLLLAVLRLPDRSGHGPDDPAGAAEEESP